MTKKDKEEINALVKRLQEESRKSTDALVEKLNKKSEQKMEHYIGALTESHQHTLDAITEQTRDIPEIKRMVGIMFENMGKQEVEIAVIKESVRDHERRLHKVER